MQALVTLLWLSIVVHGFCPASSDTGSLSAKSLKRLQREMKSLLEKSPPGVQVDFNNAYKDMSLWYVWIEGAKGSLYQGEKFQLKFKFGPQYPLESPEVTFVGSNIPVHPHVYSNGHICFSTLTDDWSPALGVESICLSILSMLSSAREKKRPFGDVLHAIFAPSNPKKTHWSYED